MRNNFTDLESPLISIIVPIYNVEKYLKRCIDSLVAQTYTNIEILLINDGSPDGCEKICKSYNDQRIYYFYKANGGLSDARNFGITYAQGEYIIFVDADDFVAPNFVEALYRVLTADQTEISMCLYQSFSGDIDYTSFESTNSLNSRIFSSDEYWMLFSSTHYSIATTVAWNKLYHRSLFDDIQFPVGKIHEDEATTYKLLYKAGRISVVEDLLYYYRENPNSIMHTKFGFKNMVQIQNLYDRYQFVVAHGDIRFAKRTVKDLYYFITQVMVTPNDKIDGVRSVRKEIDNSIRIMRPLLTGKYARMDIRIISFLSYTKPHFLMRAHRGLIDWVLDSGCGRAIFKWKQESLLTTPKGD